jgi:hydrogenase-1 operon protein HyaF
MSEHPLRWHGEPRAEGVFIGETEDAALNLIDMPSGLLGRRDGLAIHGELAAPVAEVMREILVALRWLTEEDTAGGPVRIALERLDAGDRDALSDALGSGEVRALVDGQPRHMLQESALTGVWGVTPGPEAGAWIEVGAMPSVVGEAIPRYTSDDVALPGEVPAGAMNAPALLSEIRARAAQWAPGDPNHVVNFTLLPLSEVDAALITGVLGQAPIVLESEGYGRTRVMATSLRHVWAVQYLNAMGTVILDTLEIGGVPAAVSAAQQDFEDSAERLAEILEAYAA